MDLVFRIWNSRLAYVASILLLLLQRTPLLRALVDGRLLAAPRFANVMKFTAAASAVNAAGMHAVTGATVPEVTPVAPSANPEEARVGEAFVWVFSASIPGKKARSYLVEGLPPGIEYDGRVASNSLASMSGTPTAPGRFTVEITGFHFPNLRGTATALYALSIHVEEDAVASPVGADFEITRMERTPEGSLLAFPAEPGDRYVIQSSPNLIDWQEIGHGVVGEGETEVIFTDKEAGREEVPRRFYRASKR